MARRAYCPAPGVPRRQRRRHYSLDRRPDGSLELHYNDSLAYRSDTPGLATLYLGIWLDEDGLSEGLRSALLK
ncbi:hypothetical protein ULG90_07865 [Halopseudomonas pachastrellae]|nr:hypothetical protein ULG90_07865 [Halopseudomonas pachastrellae]